VSTDTERIASLEQRLAVVEKRLGIVVSDPQPQTTPTPTPPVTRSRDLALFYTDAWEDWQAPGGLRALQSYDTCVIQADFAAAAVDSKGRQYAGGATPLAHLTGKGREVWLYASPWWVDDEARMGGPAEAFRLEKAQMARKTGALVKRNGAPLRVFGGKMLVADPRNGDYTAWLAERMIEMGHDRFFIDNAWWHQTGYHGPGIADLDWMNASAAFYGALKGAGCKLILNGGWEPLFMTDDMWSYPLAGVADGMAVEGPTGFRDTSGAVAKWWTLVGYGGGRVSDLGRLRRVAGDLQRLSLTVYLIAKWTVVVYTVAASSRRVMLIS